MTEYVPQAEGDKSKLKKFNISKISQQIFLFYTSKWSYARSPCCCANGFYGGFFTPKFLWEQCVCLTTITFQLYPLFTNMGFNTAVSQRWDMNARKRWFNWFCFTWKWWQKLWENYQNDVFMTSASFGFMNLGLARFQVDLTTEKRMRSRFLSQH